MWERIRIGPCPERCHFWGHDRNGGAVLRAERDQKENDARLNDVKADQLLYVVGVRRHDVDAPQEQNHEGDEIGSLE
jgi:hypothetical protein